MSDTILRQQMRKQLLGGYDEAEIRAAFERVENPNHWKDPVDCIVRDTDQDERDLIAFAISFFTSTEASWSRVGQTSVWRVRADGYRAGPAGDH